jgi:hypothetical protein
MIPNTESMLLYCIQCERAFQSHSKNSCTYDDCKGGMGDIWEWGAILELNRDYPKIPVHTKEYPLFGNGDHINIGKSERQSQHQAHGKRNR